MSSAKLDFDTQFLSDSYTMSAMAAPLFHTTK